MLLLDVTNVCGRPVRAFEALGLDDDQACRRYQASARGQFRSAGIPEQIVAMFVLVGGAGDERRIAAFQCATAEEQRWSCVAPASLGCDSAAAVELGA